MKNSCHWRTESHDDLSLMMKCKYLVINLHIFWSTREKNYYFAHNNCHFTNSKLFNIVDYHPQVLVDRTQHPPFYTLPPIFLSHGIEKKIEKGVGVGFNIAGAYFVWKITILRKKIIFFPGAPPPPWSAHLLCMFKRGTAEIHLPRF